MRNFLTKKDCTSNCPAMNTRGKDIKKISNISKSTGSTKHNSTTDYPTMNTRGRVLKRSSDTQQSQHLKKKIKTSNVKKQLVILSETDMQMMEVSYSPIQMLNDDCLTLIFFHLPPDERLKIESVCKKWRSVNRSSLWSIKKLNFPYVEPDWNEVRKKIPRTNFWVPESLLEFKQRFTYIPRLLALRREYIKELDLSALTQSIILTKLKEHSFPNLIKLKIRIIYKWEPEHCENLFDKMIKLESLHIATDWRYRMPMNFYQSISTLANTLKELTIINFTYHQYSYENNLYSVFGRTGSVKYQLPLLIKLKSLRFLELKGYHLEIDTFEALKHFNLEKLIVARCNVRKLAGLYYILDLKKLKELALGPCDENIDAFLKKLSNNWKNLSKLTLLKPNASHEAIKAISSHKEFTTHVVNDSKALAIALGRLQN